MARALAQSRRLRLGGGAAAARATGHAGLVDAATVPLPEGARLLVAEGASSGETFLSLGGEWIVCDAFTNFERPVTGVLGLALTLMRIRHGLSLGNTFKWIVLRDRERYRKWLFSELDRDPPRKLHFSHGAPLEAPDLAEKLRALTSARLF